jgi:LAO/AO transport system kinase
MTTGIVERIRTNRRELARLLTRIENGSASAEMAELYPHTGKAHIIGITGAPGTGKSSLVNALAQHYRQNNLTVGIVAVDPTSPFSGGAILGDRIRMRDRSGDSGVFIRSMATRGSLGGLARATSDVARALDAAGFDRVLIETVGAGQSEVDIARAAHTTLVVEAPGLGDDVQAIKAGILEIADILVVNKADRPGLEITLRALRAMLDLGHRAERIAQVKEMHHGQMMTVPAVSKAVPDENTAWQPPIAQTVSTEPRGIEELAGHIAAHRDYLQRTGLLVERERARIQNEILERVRDEVLSRLLSRIDEAQWRDLIARVQSRTLDPAGAAAVLLE